MRKLSPEELKERKEILDKMKFNKDIENIKSLMAVYDNSTIEGKINVLEDLDFLLHQIDNARDFVSLGGLNKIILPALESLEISEEIVAKAAILVGSASQGNLEVQVSCPILKYFVMKIDFTKFFNFRKQFSLKLRIKFQRSFWNYFKKMKLVQSKYLKI